MRTEVTESTGIWQRQRQVAETPDEMRTLLKDAVLNQHVPSWRDKLRDVTEWLAFRLLQFDDYVCDEAFPEGCIPSKPEPILRDLHQAWRVAGMAWNACESGDVDCVLELSFDLGMLVQKINVRPHEKHVKREQDRRESTRSTNARRGQETREKCRQAVRDAWEDNPSLTLSSIQNKLASLDEFPKLRQIVEHTKGMTPESCAIRQ